jgi:hypothetical protein
VFQPLDDRALFHCLTEFRENHGLRHADPPMI